MITVQEYAAITQRVIRADGFDAYLPTACYSEQQVVRALEGLPPDIDQEAAVLKWAREHSEPGEEYLVAFKSGPSTFTVIRVHGKERESATFEVERGRALPATQRSRILRSLHRRKKGGYS